MKRGCRDSPARTNEDYCLELPGIREWPGSSRPSEHSEGGGPRYSFLSETKIDRNRIQDFRWRLGMKNMVVKDCKGKSGGLAVFWKKEINFQLRAVSGMYIDADVVEKDGFA